MRSLHVALLGAMLLGDISAARADDSAVVSGREHPLARGRLLLRDGAPAARRVSFRARWKATTAGKLGNPAFVGSTLRVSGEGPTDGDSGLIQLDGTHWHSLGHPAGSAGYRYADPTGSAGGVRIIALKIGRRSGVLRIVGGRDKWGYQVTGKQQEITVSFTVGDQKWCAVFGGHFMKNERGRVVVVRDDAPQACPCARGNSTWAAIQEVIIERNSCAASACHTGPLPAGGLDLNPDVAYKNLVDVPSESSSLKRVEPGEQALSFLYRKLAAKTSPDEYTLSAEERAPMPQSGAAISKEELEALRLWIRAGAPETGVVRNTENLLDACLPPPDPIKIRPPDVPQPQDGLQLHAPPWNVAAHGEGEVCYATFYDVSATVPVSARLTCPEGYGGSDRECFYYNRAELTQDPNSHHSIIHTYLGKYDTSLPGWDLWTCSKGADNGKTCQKPGGGVQVPTPEVVTCATGGTCKQVTAYDIRNADGFGPFTCKDGPLDGQPCDPYTADNGGCGADGYCRGNVASTIACIGYGPPDMGTDVTGTGTATAPAFGGSQQPISFERYADGVYSLLPVRGFIIWNSHAFNLNDQPTTNEQWYNLFYAKAPAEQQYPLQGIFESQDIFAMNVPAFEKQELCRTVTLPKGAHLFQLSSHTHRHGKQFRVWGPGIHDRCGSEAGRIPPQLCKPEPDDQKIFLTTIYNDPLQLRFDPAWDLGKSDDADTRTFKFCSVYDNGASNEEEVKRQSTSPFPPLFAYFEQFVGGPCKDDTVVCLNNGPQHGKPCAGKDRLCDSSPTAGDGVCDACPVHGGVTTEDEMFILIGSYYVTP